MRALDHIAVVAATLDEGAAHVRRCLGVETVPGGHHALMGTHNRLLGLGPRLYLEVIAVDPAAQPPGRPRWFGLDSPPSAPRLNNWILRCDDIRAELALSPAGAGRATELERGDLRWTMGVPDAGVQPFDDTYPALIQWRGDAHPSGRLPGSGCGLLRLEITHPDGDALRAAARCDDPRVVIATGPRALRALIATPDGDRWLT